MTNEEKKKLYAALCAPFPEEAIERTDGRTTGRGYDTTGIKVQYVINRLNDVVGLGNWRAQESMRVREIVTPKGRPMFDAVCEMTLQLGEWVNGTFVPFAEAHATGGHQSVSEADAMKGAATNSRKRAAAMFGCGKQAYEGTLDDDNVPKDEEPLPPPVRHVQTAPRPQPAPPPPVEEMPAQQPSQTSAGTSRNRLTSKQLAALMALSRKLGHQQSAFRQMVKQQFGVQPEFLDKNAASTLIGQLSARASNGHSHPAGYEAEA